MNKDRAISRTDLIDLAMRHAGADEATSIVGLSIYRCDAPSAPVAVVYRPVFCLVLQGVKTTFVGERAYRYAAGDYLIASLELPVTGQVTLASGDEPYLAVAIDLSGAVAAELTADHMQDEHSPSAGALVVGSAGQDLLDPVARLLRLLDRPRDVAVLVPLIERELVYRLLTIDPAGVMSRIARAGAGDPEVHRAAAWMRRHYARQLRIEDAASSAGMSASAFHRRFKAATDLSPVQYHKQVRLLEARRLLLARQGDVATVGLTVGYESASQFNREYSRMFGNLPGRDRALLGQTADR